MSTDLSGAVVKYGLTEGVYDLNSMPSYTDAGSYVVYYQVSCPYYDTVTGSVTVDIQKKQPAISLDTSKGYIAVTTDSDGTVTAQSSNTHIIDNISVEGNAVKVLPTRNGGSGDVVMTVIVNESKNYKSVSAKQAVTIGPNLISPSLGFWNPPGSYAYGYLDSTGDWLTDRNSMWKTTNLVTVPKGLYYIRGFSGALPRFCLYNNTAAGSKNLYLALRTVEGYAVSVPSTKYLRLSICVGAELGISDCELKSIVFK